MTKQDTRNIVLSMLDIIEAEGSSESEVRMAKSTLVDAVAPEILADAIYGSDVHLAFPDIADRVAEDLFTDGAGRKAERLVMDYDGTQGGTGWSEKPARDRVLKSLVRR